MENDTAFLFCRSNYKIREKKSETKQKSVYLREKKREREREIIN